MKISGFCMSLLALVMATLGTSGLGCGGLPLDLLKTLPSDETVTLRVPGGSVDSAPSGLASFHPLLGSTSEYHSQVVQISTTVNANVLELIRRIRGVAAYPPSKQQGNTSTWGPYSPGGLDNLNYRLVAVKNGPAKYTIRLDGRAAGSNAESDFRLLLDGNIEGILGGQNGKGKGTLTVHLDNRAALDSNNLAKGQLKIVYDNTADPRKIDVDLLGFDPLATGDDTAPPPANATYRYTEATDKAGTFLLTFFMNVQDATLPAPEAVTLQSRWTTQGSGRGDATLSGPDIATQLHQQGLAGDTINTTECWDDTFGVAFQDTTPAQLRGALKDLQGDATACAFTQADYAAAPAPNP